MRIPAVVTRYGETVMMPLFLVGVYAAFVATSGMHGVALWVSVAFLAIVVVLWFAFLRLKVHAQASRLAGIGDPEGLLALVARELPRCLTESARRPLHVHAAVAHNLRGDFAAARRELDASDLLGPGHGRRGRGWIALAAATDVVTRTEQGDVAGARASYERGVMPFAALAPFGGMELVARECEARLKLAEGDPAGARAAVAPLVKNIRLSDGTRAQVHALLARAALALGEPAVAAEHAARAHELAPRCQLLAATPTPASPPTAA